MAPNINANLRIDDDVPDDDDFVTPPPSLTHSPTLPGSESELGEDVEELESIHDEPICLAMPESSDKRRLIDVFRTQRSDPASYDLSVKALERVFNYLPTKSDQCALTFVDKSTMVLLMERLYHTIPIDLSKYPHNLKATTNLFRTNPARHFIKHVVFDDSNIVDKCQPPPGFDYLASLVIDHLPLYQLERFDWPADFELAPVLTHRLMDRQDNLKNIAIYGNALNIRWKERKVALEAMHNLEAVRVSPNNKFDLRNVHYIIKRYALKELHIDLRTYEPAERELDFTKAGKQDFGIFASLFEHVGSLRNVPPKYQLLLTKLTLWEVNLFASAITWQNVLRLNTLKELEIWDCPFAPYFLKIVGRAQLSLSKLSFVHNDCLDDRKKVPPCKGDLNMIIPSAVSDVLWALIPDADRTSKSAGSSGLKHLHLDIDGDESWYDKWEQGALAHLAPDLEILSLDFWTGNDNNAPFFDHIPASLRYCDPQRLRQLLLHVPIMKEFHTLDLDKLNPTTFMLAIMYGDQDVTAQKVANETFRCLRTVHGNHTRLRVFATSIGRDDGQAQGYIDPGETQYFVRCEANVMGRKQEIMVSVSFAEIKKSEKEIDILLRSPCEISKYGRGQPFPKTALECTDDLSDGTLQIERVPKDWNAE